MKSKVFRYRDNNNAAITVLLKYHTSCKTEKRRSAFDLGRPLLMSACFCGHCTESLSYWLNRCSCHLLRCSIKGYSKKKNCANNDPVRGFVQPPWYNVKHLFNYIYYNQFSSCDNACWSIQTNCHSRYKHACMSTCQRGGILGTIDALLNGEIKWAQ